MLERHVMLCLHGGSEPFQTVRQNGGQKEVTQYFPNVERKELPTQNSITRENTLQE